MYDMQNAVIKQTNHKIGSAGSSNDLDISTSMVFLYDKDKNLVYYHLVTDEEIIASRRSFKDTYIEFEPALIKVKVTTSDFNIIRKVNDVIDLNYRYSGGSSSTTEDGKLSSMTIGPFFFENDTVEYIIESKINSLKIKM